MDKKVSVAGSFTGQMCFLKN